MWYYLKKVHNDYTGKQKFLPIKSFKVFACPATYSRAKSEFLFAYWYNIPENLSTGTAYENAEESISIIDEAISLLDSAY